MIFKRRWFNIDVISNITNELLFVGSIYKKPDLVIDYGYNTRSKYDFHDDATKFFYDNAEIIYQTRSQEFNRSIIGSYMAEDADRLSLYKKYGGWKTIENWMGLAVTDNIQGYFDVLKKYSLLREYQRNGFDVSKIMKHPKFEMLNAMDIYRLIRSKADRIHTVILTNEEAQILNSNIKTTILKCMETPDLILKVFTINQELILTC